MHHHPTLLDKLLKDEKVLAVYLSGIQEWGPCPCPGHPSIRLGCERSGALGPLGQGCGGLHSTKGGRRSCSRSWLQECCHVLVPPFEVKPVSPGSSGFRQTFEPVRFSPSFHLSLALSRSSVGGAGTFGGCFSSREASCRVRIPATFWTQKSLPIADKRGRPLDCVPSLSSLRTRGSPPWCPVTARSGSLTSDTILLEDNTASGLGAVMSIMCKLGLSGLHFPGFHSLCFQVGGPPGSPTA